jgi:DNA-3-methyladenine glycosylase I
MHPYCKYVQGIQDKNDVDKIYHDLHYGVRIEDDNELFCRLVMEINQAGLSWHTILVKEKNFRKAYNNFDIKKVAKYGEKDFARLMNDAGIIRNRLKIHAAIYNAQMLLAIQKEFGSFRKWLVDEEGKESLSEAKATCGRHAVFEHVDKFPFGHHGFVITSLDHSLLELKASALVNWIIEL